MSASWFYQTMGVFWLLMGLLTRVFMSVFSWKALQANPSTSGKPTLTTIYSFRILNLPIPYQIKQLIPIFCWKGRHPRQHFIDDAPETPPIDSCIVPLLIEYLWCQILWCPTNSLSRLFSPLDDFRQTEVSEFNISLFIKQNIFRF